MNVKVNELPSSSEPLTVFVLSDSSGETAAHVIQAALCQFAPEVTKIERLPRVKSTEDITSILWKIPSRRSFLAYTLVHPEYRKALEAELQRVGLPAWDLLGPLMTRISELTDREPLSQPGRLHLLDDDYFRKIEAVNFAVHYDDGRVPERLERADVVLIGVSRSSKTPNCMYLAQHYGLNAANVPLVMNVEPPLSLFQINKRKVVGLDIDPHHLQTLRMTRAHAMGIGGASQYSDLDEIKREVQYAKGIFREVGCHTIDVSSRAVEETSSEIYLYLMQKESI